jgi:serine phosphatase RsbU (regulator of sigma subunit)
MLPTVPQIAGLHVAARYVPAREDAQVGGDWYDVFQFHGHEPVLVVGDVVGHDLEAATQMGQLRNVLRGLAWGRARRPAEVLTMLDDVNGSLGVADLATVVCGTIRSTPDGAAHLRWSNAGHLPPLLVSADGTARYLDEVGDLLIGLPGTGARHEAEVELPPGSTLLLYTDGLVESRLDQLDTGMGALFELAAGLAAEPVEVLCDRLVTELAAYAEDDIALLVIRVP